MLKIIYEDADESAPYIFDDGAEIVLTIDGELYARGTYGNSMSVDVFNDIDHAWELDNTLKGNAINRILDDIKPYANKLYKQMDVSNGKGYYINEDVAYELEEKISDILYDWNYNNDSEDTNVILWDFYDFFNEMMNYNEYHSPEGYGEIVEDPVDYNAAFEIDPEEAINIVYEKYFDRIESVSFKNILKEIEKVHQAYIDDGLEKLFYDNFIPRLINEYPEYSYDGKNFYYDGELLE